MNKPVKKFLNNHSGFGMVEILVASGLGVLVSMLALDSLQVAVYTTQSYKASLQEQALTKSMGDYLSNEVNCKKTLKPSKLSDSSNQIGQVNTADGTTALTRIGGFTSDLISIKKLKLLNEGDNINHPQRVLHVYYTKTGLKEHATLRGEACTLRDQSGCYVQSCLIDYQCTGNDCNDDDDRCSPITCHAGQIQVTQNNILDAINQECKPGQVLIHRDIDNFDPNRGEFNYCVSIIKQNLCPEGKIMTGVKEDGSLICEWPKLCGDTEEQRERQEWDTDTNTCICKKNSGLLVSGTSPNKSCQCPAGTVYINGQCKCGTTDKQRERQEWDNANNQCKCKSGLEPTGPDNDKCQCPNKTREIYKDGSCQRCPEDKKYANNLGNECLACPIGQHEVTGVIGQECRDQGGMFVTQVCTPVTGKKCCPIGYNYVLGNFGTCHKCPNLNLRWSSVLNRCTHSCPPNEPHYYNNQCHKCPQGQIHPQTHAYQPGPPTIREQFNRNVCCPSSKPWWYTKNGRTGCQPCQQNRHWYKNKCWLCPKSRPVPAWGSCSPCRGEATLQYSKAPLLYNNLSAEKTYWCKCPKGKRYGSGQGSYETGREGCQPCETLRVGGRVTSWASCEIKCFGGMTYFGDFQSGPDRGQPMCCPNGTTKERCCGAGYTSKILNDGRRGCCKNGRCCYNGYYLRSNPRDPDRPCYRLHLKGWYGE